ncbi:hypothetical protein GCM10011297_09570 [Bacterioplanes sanyensis]|uniref:hypothetical protein n=1 Tax=Bacterioplanes sanyensis TaxID=1249553 RepID=UPI00167C1942|nr:hypothetical protein [Bacterioplanes sanyensis]GGY38486.1 hypothetical protein GCM10011297_09570 [Bacterioplanes sanyensis]
MEFNRQNLTLLQKIKRLAKEEQGAEVHFDSKTLENDLRTLVSSGVSAELLALIEDFLPTREPDPAITHEPRLYRGSAQLVDDRPRTARRTQRVYRGQVVSA